MKREIRSMNKRNISEDLITALLLVTNTATNTSPTLLRGKARYATKKEKKLPDSRIIVQLRQGTENS